ncbi:MAG: hypothetical protein OEV97_09255 [Betaproteobacteria bacterium]|nr:hypothetical protein [Betaproteobacteria bacterium]
MSNVNVSSNAALTFLNTEASLALEEAKRLRAQLESIPKEDAATRAALLKQIEDLVQRSLRFSNAVTSTAGSSK